MSVTPADSWTVWVHLRKGLQVEPTVHPSSPHQPSTVLSADITGLLNYHRITHNA